MAKIEGLLKSGWHPRRVDEWRRYLCDSHLQGEGRIHLTKCLWVIVDGKTKDDSQDAMPISFEWQGLIQRIVKGPNGKRYTPSSNVYQ